MGTKASDSLLPNSSPKAVIVEKTLTIEPEENPDTTECDCNEFKYGVGKNGLMLSFVLKYLTRQKPLLYSQICQIIHLTKSPLLTVITFKYCKIKLRNTFIE